MNDIHGKYDLVQKEKVCNDLSLCSTRPEEICYTSCKIHNPLACDGDDDDEDLEGLPGVDWSDDDVFEDEDDTFHDFSGVMFNAFKKILHNLDLEICIKTKGWLE